MHVVAMAVMVLVLVLEVMYLPTFGSSQLHTYRKGTVKRYGYR